MAILGIKFLIPMHTLLNLSINALKDFFFFFFFTLGRDIDEV